MLLSQPPPGDDLNPPNQNHQKDPFFKAIQSISRESFFLPNPFASWDYSLRTGHYAPRGRIDLKYLLLI
jgi:hypothetical protein